MTTLREEDLQDQLTVFSELHESVQKRLQESDISELLLVQQATYKPFLGGQEIVVK